MVYLITFLFLLYGTLYYCGKQIQGLKSKNPLLPPRGIMVTFVKAEWDSLTVSMISNALYLTILAVGLNNKDVNFPKVVMMFNAKIPTIWFVYAMALVWGWGSTRLAYRWLGTAEYKVIKKVEERFGAADTLKDEPGKDATG